MAKQQAKIVPHISIVGWHLALIGEQPDNGSPPPLLSQGQIISEIGKASWMVQFFGKQVYMRVLSEEQLGDFAIFPNQQMAHGFLDEFYSQWATPEDADRNAAPGAPVGDIVDGGPPAMHEGQENTAAPAVAEASEDVAAAVAAEVASD